MEQDYMQLMELQSKLMLEERLPIATAGLMAFDALNHFDERVKEGVLLWLKDELPDTFAVGEFNLENVRYFTGATTFHALAIMNIMITQPEASMALRWFEEADDYHE